MDRIRSCLIWIAVTTVMVIFSLMTLVTSLWEQSGKTYLKWARRWGAFWLWVSGVRVTVIGQEKLDPNVAYVVASNHASYFDIPVLLRHLPLNFRMVAKQSIAYVPVLGWGMKRGDFIFIKRGANRDAIRSLDGAIQRLKEGKSVVLFADGTRSKNGSLQPFKRGAFLVAEKAGAPILPVTIIGSHRIMQRDSALIYPGEITVVIGSPILNVGQSADALMKEAFERVSSNYHAYVSA